MDHGAARVERGLRGPPSSGLPVCMYVHYYCYAIYEIYVLTGRERSEGLVSDGTGEGGGPIYIIYISDLPFPGCLTQSWRRLIVTHDLIAIDG